MASFMKEYEHLKIQLKDIKLATNEFDDKTVIGKGGFGKVYEGELCHSQSERKSLVALKRLDRKHGQGDPQFWKEIMMLSRYRHKNLISLLGYCVEEGEMILIYEHASRGSLERYLKDASLTWKERIKICIHAAKGLRFLHDPNESQQRVLHCDIKSANILLDDNLNAKLSDFGLSKMGSAEQQFSVIITNAVGTPGYCDPLYMETYQLTKESDVYSLGVVLFEVMCGRQCVEFSNGQLNVFVPFWRKTYEEDRLEEIIFKDLTQQIHPSALKTFASIAYQCLKSSREERPSVSLIVEKLMDAFQVQERQDKYVLGWESFRANSTYIKNYIDQDSKEIDEILSPPESPKAIEGKRLQVTYEDLEDRTTVSQSYDRKVVPCPSVPRKHKPRHVGSSNQDTTSAKVKIGLSTN